MLRVARSSGRKELEVQVPPMADEDTWHKYDFETLIATPEEHARGRKDQRARWPERARRTERASRIHILRWPGDDWLRSGCQADVVIKSS
ncbi:hypothetical protein E2C01_045973 [Portunus trituberculatus]|uniref:Uncharacterized protein n=1 Tax=Portunus trituberculatus TaxID=210409 RepID=A0A5B7FZP3_PORTR|nr:hypothetical protein [Portunus trituberculatus]